MPASISASQFSRAGHLGEVQKLNSQVEAAQKEGDTETLRTTLSKLAKLAARLLVEHGFVKQDGTSAAFRGDSVREQRVEKGAMPQLAARDANE